MNYKRQSVLDKTLVVSEWIVVCKNSFFKHNYLYYYFDIQRPVFHPTTRTKRLQNKLWAPNKLLINNYRIEKHQLR